MNAWIRAASAAMVLLAAVPTSAEPKIVARVAPTPNAGGWNNSMVTVAFRCEGVVSCPLPVTLRDDGRDWLVTESVSDETGAAANVRIAVNIDLTAPKVIISSPTDGTTTRQTAVRVTASATDLGSGLRSATCNGHPATLLNGTITCIVRMHEGLNGVIVQAMDAAGNSGSTGIHIWRPAVNPAITIVPGVATLARGEQRSVEAVDVAGRTLAGLAWTVSNPLIASLERYGDTMVVRAVGPGTVTIRARSSQAIAEAHFTVSPDAQLPYGTTQWSVLPVPGFKGAEPIYTHPTPGGPDIVVMERAVDGRRIVLKATTSAPSVLWVESPALREDEDVVAEMGERFGGVLLLVSGIGRQPGAIVRAGRPTNGPLWRYESSGTLGNKFAQGWDGTVYVIETARDGFPHLLILDGATGEAKYRWPIPRSVHSSTESCSDIESVETPATLSNPSVPDGEVGAFTFVTLDSSCVSGATRPIETLHLVRAAPSGHVDVKALQVFERPIAEDRPSIELAYVIPHFPSAVLVPWKLTAPDGSVENHVTRLEGDLKTDYTLPFMGELGIGDDTAYTLTNDKRTIVNFEPATGRVKWIRHVATGTIWVAMVTVHGEIVIQTRGPLLDENYRPVPNASVNPNLQ